MSGISASTLRTMIRNYTEVDSNILTDDILENIILNAQQRIMLDVPIDADRKTSEGGLAVDDNTINCPAGCLFVRAVEVFESTVNTEGEGTFLQKKDQSYLGEYVNRLTGTEGGSTGQDVTGLPKYYSMFGVATTGTSTATSGAIYIAPTPNANYKYIIHYNAMPTGLETNTGGTYISTYFPQGK